MLCDDVSMHIMMILCIVKGVQQHSLIGHFQGLSLTGAFETSNVRAGRLCKSDRSCRVDCKSSMDSSSRFVRCSFLGADYNERHFRISWGNKETVCFLFEGCRTMFFIRYYQQACQFGQARTRAACSTRQVGRYV
jgi:hypothetical protein